MIALMDAIKERRSVRKYNDRQVSQDLLEQVLEAGRWAQSWANTQCWEIVVVRDPAIKTALQATVPQGNPSFQAVVATPIVLAVCGKRQSAGFYKGAAATKLGDWLMFDLGVLTQNIALAAHALGLATVVIGMFDHAKAKDILRVPADYELVSLMPLGYPAQAVSPPPRRAVSEFTHENTF